MMKKKIILETVLVMVIGLLLFIYLFPCFAYNLFSRNNGQDSTFAVAISQRADKSEAQPPFRNGETINYEVRLHSFKIGRAQLTYQGVVRMKAGSAFLIMFLTDVANFYDLERIYANVSTFNPFLVERQLSFFRNKERIEEDYASQLNSVRITKYKKTKGKTRVISSDRAFQHVISSLYYLRALKGLGIGQQLSLNLPLAKVKFIVKRIEEIKVPAGRFKAFYIESMPRKYKIWLSADEKKLPLRAEGMISLAPAVMIMTK